MSSGKKNIPSLKSRLLSFSRSTVYTTLLMLIVISADILHGQIRRTSIDSVGQTVRNGVGEGGTVPIRISRLFEVDSTQSINPMIDSLDIRPLQIEIAKAEVRVSETRFWTRIIPEIHLSASFGFHDIMFVDPRTFTPYILPRDAYRLSVSVSLNDVFGSSKHTQALLELEQLRAEQSRRTIRQLYSRNSLEQQLFELEDLATSLDEELRLIKELLHFNEMRFQQGKIEFDALIHSKLQLIGATKSIIQLHQQEALIRQKLASASPNDIPPY